MTANKVEIKKDKSGVSIAATGWGLVAIVIIISLWLFSKALPDRLEQFARETATQEINEAITEASKKSTPLAMHLEIEELKKEVESLRKELKIISVRNSELKAEYRQLEREIDPACRDGSKQKVRSTFRIKTSSTPNFLPDRWNYWGQEQVVKDLEAGICCTEPKDYEWKFKSCEAKRNNYLGIG